jgi:CRP-like cAMP-binding protein
VALEDDIRILRAAPLLSDIPIDGLRLLAFSAEQRSLFPRDVLFRAGEDAPGGFVLVSGVLNLQIGSRPPLRVAEPGRLIDELALICEVSRLSTATAEERTRLLQLPRPAFLRMLGEYPDCAARLHAQLSTRLRNDAAELAGIAAALDSLGRR